MTIEKILNLCGAIGPETQAKIREAISAYARKVHLAAMEPLLELARGEVLEEAAKWTEALKAGEVARANGYDGTVSFNATHDALVDVARGIRTLSTRAPSEAWNTGEGSVSTRPAQADGAKSEPSPAFALLAEVVEAELAHSLVAFNEASWFDEVYRRRARALSAARAFVNAQAEAGAQASPAQPSRTDAVSGDAGVTSDHLPSRAASESTPPVSASPASPHAEIERDAAALCDLFNNEDGTYQDFKFESNRDVWRRVARRAREMAEERDESLRHALGLPAPAPASSEACPSWVPSVEEIAAAWRGEDDGSALTIGEQARAKRTRRLVASRAPRPSEVDVRRLLLDYWNAMHGCSSEPDPGHLKETSAAMTAALAAQSIPTTAAEGAQEA